MATAENNNDTTKSTERATAITTTELSEVATAGTGPQAISPNNRKVANEVKFGILGSLLGTLPVALIAHALFPVLVVPTLVAGTIVFLFSGVAWMVDSTVPSNFPEQQKRLPDKAGIGTGKDRCGRIKAAAEATCDEVLAKTTLGENETVFFRDPSDAEGKLALRITEISEYRENAQSPLMQRIVARVFTAALAGEEFSKTPEIAGVGPIVRQRPIPSAIDLILAEATANQARGNIPPSISARPAGVGALTLRVDAPSCV